MAQERKRGCAWHSVPPLGALFRVVLCGNVFLCGLFRASCYDTYSCLYIFAFLHVYLYVCTFGKDVRWNHRGTRLGALFRVVLCGDVFLWTLFRVVMNMCLSKIVCYHSTTYS